MTTKELAAKFGVKVASIHSMYYVNDHYRGYKPEAVGYFSKKLQYNWIPVPEDELEKMIGHKK